MSDIQRVARRLELETEMNEMIYISTDRVIGLMKLRETVEETELREKYMEHSYPLTKAVKPIDQASVILSQFHLKRVLDAFSDYNEVKLIITFGDDGQPGPLKIQPTNDHNFEVMVSPRIYEDEGDD